MARDEREERDRRLFMTFPIDFDEHPKVAPLSDAAFRAFVEMNGYSRRHDLDGRIPVAVAKKRWRVRVLGELVTSHPERPLVLLEDDVYVIREYAKHQFTTSALADLRAKRSAAGAKGGAAKAAARGKQASSKPVASATAIAKQTGDKDQGSRIKDQKTDDRDSHSHVTQSDARDAADDDEFIIGEFAKLGISTPARRSRTLSLIRGVVGEVADAVVVDVAREVLLLALAPVEYPVAYIERTCHNSPGEVEAIYRRLSPPRAVGVA